MDISVKDTYNNISNDFDRTRYKIWNCTSNFLDSIEKNKFGLEVGCGNGKNLQYRNDLNIKGIDICDNFVNISKNKNLDVIQGDMINLPFENNTFDFVFSVASLHHLDSSEKRIKAINEMCRVCKPGAKIFILVWAFEQENNSKRKFITTDEMVSWKSSSGEIYYRYYHLYKENELYNEFKLSNYNFELINKFYEKGNWGIIVHLSNFA